MEKMGSAILGDDAYAMTFLVCLWLARLQIFDTALSLLNWNEIILLNQICARGREKKREREIEQHIHP